MKKGILNDRKVKDGILQGLIYLSTVLTLAILVVIIGFILYKGVPGINFNFLTRMWDDKTTFVNIERYTDEKIKNKPEVNYVASLGITISKKGDEIIISDIEKDSPVKSALNMKNQPYALKKQDIIAKVGNTNMTGKSISDAVAVLNNVSDTIRIKVIRPGGGIVPMLVATIYVIVLSLCLAAPIGIGSAIYLNEYAKRGRTLNLIRFAIQNLAGIPSIIYGLFGMLLFVQIAKMQYSILAGALTLSIMLLPTIISTTEEALKEIPNAYRESSYGLGATKLQTIARIILPGALPGILVAILLSIGRIVGESAALIWTAGTVAQIPKAFVGGEGGGATLTTKMYWLIKESGDLSTASSLAVVLLILVIALNIASKMITRLFLNLRGTK